MRQIRLSLVCLTMLSTLLLSPGCGATRVVMTSPHDDIRLAEPVKAKIFVKDKTGTWIKSSNRVKLQEGDFVIQGAELKK